MSLNENNYKKIYEVAACAGIENFNLSGANKFEAYTKIADWINGCDELNDIFTAEAVEYSSGKYRVDLKAGNGGGLCYGDSGSNQNCRLIKYESFILSVGQTPLDKLRLMVIKSRYGFLAGLYNINESKRYQINMAYTKAVDDAGKEKDIALFFNSDNIYVFLGNGITDGYYINGFFDSGRNSKSEKTGLFTFMVPGSDCVCEHIREVRGASIYDHAFFETGGKTWCEILGGEKNIGLALEIE